LKFISSCLERPKRPFTMILGGRKVNDKLDVIKYLLGLADAVLIGGGMAYTFLLAQGYNVGKSVKDLSKLDDIKEYLEMAKKYNTKIFLPRDVVVCDELDYPTKIETVPVTEIRDNHVGVDIGFDTIDVDSYFVGSENTENEFNASTYRLINSLQVYDTVHFSQYPVAFAGRAADNLVECVSSSTELPSGKCQFPFWLGGDLKNPEGIEIDFEGNVTLCPCLCIGNAVNHPLTELIDDYDFSEHPLIRVLAEQGPSGLLPLAKAKGYKDNRRFINECHLCYEMRKFLRNYHPDELAPANCYYLYKSSQGEA